MIDTAAVVVNTVPLRVHADIIVAGGEIQIENDGRGIVWGNNASKILDDCDLHIYTDDVLHFDIGAHRNAMTLDTSSNVKIDGTRLLV